MAAIESPAAGAKRSGPVRRKRSSTRVDLTAMVDLAFLLITFFILTTTLQKSRAMQLVMPDKEPIERQHTEYPASRTMTILLGSNDKLEWYTGLPDKPLTAPSVNGFGKDGVRKVLVEEGAKIWQAQRKPMIVLVKPSDRSNYNNLVAIMDELNITNNQIRALADISPAEVELLKRDGIYNN